MFFSAYIVRAYSRYQYVALIVWVVCSTATVQCIWWSFILCKIPVTTTIKVKSQNFHGASYNMQQATFNAPTVWVKKIPHGIFWHFPQTVGNFSIKFCMPIIRSYLCYITNFYSVTCNFDEVNAILSATTQYTRYAQNVHHWPKRMLAFSVIFPKELGIYSPNFTRLLHVPIYARIQICV